VPLLRFRETILQLCELIKDLSYRNSLEKRRDELHLLENVLKLEERYGVGGRLGRQNTSSAGVEETRCDRTETSPTVPAAGVPQKLMRDETN
jgi:hypothetical protein